MSTIPQYSEIKRRLHERQMQASRYGINTEPHVNIEIEDLTALINLFDLIDIHRKNLDTLLKQRSQYGAQTPLHILNQIRSERQEVVLMRQNAQRRYKQYVPDHPVDADADADLDRETPIRVAASSTNSNRDRVVVKLHEIEHLIAEIKELL